MGRDFDGAGNDIDCGSDASVDGFTQKTIACWVRPDAGSDNFDVICSKNGTNAGWHLSWQTFGGVSAFSFFQRWDGDCNWKGTNSLTAGLWYHLALVYDGGSTANDPTMYVNGASVAITESGAPAGTRVDADTGSLRLGELNNGTNGFDGAIEAFVYVNGLWTAEQVNRHRWHGRPGGAVAVLHPLLTDKLANEGTATANGTATGTSVVSSARPTYRPCTAAMGMGVGW